MTSEFLALGNYVLQKDQLAIAHWKKYLETFQELKESENVSARSLDHSMLA